LTGNNHDRTAIAGYEGADDDPTMNRNLGTLQYQSLSLNVQNPLNDIMGGTRTMHPCYDGMATVAGLPSFGDGGQSGH